MNKKYFLVVTLLTMLSIFLSKYILNLDELVANFYSEQLTKEKVNELLESQEKYAWIGYVIVPITIVLRASLVALCLQIGLLFYDFENRTKFTSFLKITLFGEFVLLLVGYFKLLYFAFVKTDYTLDDLQKYFPLSYTNFLDLTKIEPWLVYPLQTINIFEIGYFFVLVYGLYKLLKNNYWKSFEMVAVSYGTGLTIWLGLIMFLTLNLS